MFYVVLILFTLVSCALVVVTVQNLSTQAHLFVFTWQTPELPIGLLILLAFILGAFLLYIVSVFSALPDRREKKVLQKRVTELEQQIVALRQMSVPPAPVQPEMPPVQMPGMQSPLQS